MNPYPRRASKSENPSLRAGYPCRSSGLAGAFVLTRGTQPGIACIAPSVRSKSQGFEELGLRRPTPSVHMNKTWCASDQELAPILCPVISCEYSRLSISEPRVAYIEIPRSLGISLLPRSMAAFTRLLPEPDPEAPIDSWADCWPWTQGPSATASSSRGSVPIAASRRKAPTASAASSRTRTWTRDTM